MSMGTSWSGRTLTSEIWPYGSVSLAPNTICRHGCIYADDEFEYEIVDGEIRSHITSRNYPMSIPERSSLRMQFSLIRTAQRKQPRMLWTKSERHGSRGRQRQKPGTYQLHSRDVQKTVINRACKIGIKSSDDSSLALLKEVMKANEDELAEAAVEAEIKENANQELIDIEYEVEDETPAAEETKKNRQRKEIAEKPKQEKNKRNRSRVNNKPYLRKDLDSDAYHRAYHIKEQTNLYAVIIGIINRCRAVSFALLWQIGKRLSA